MQLTKNERLKNALRLLRNQHGILQQEVAELIGMSPGALTKIASGNANLTEGVLRAICEKTAINHEYVEKGVGVELGEKQSKPALVSAPTRTVKSALPAKPRFIPVHREYRVTKSGNELSVDWGKPSDYNAMTLFDDADRYMICEDNAMQPDYQIGTEVPIMDVTDQFEMGVRLYGYAHFVLISGGMWFFRRIRERRDSDPPESVRLDPINSEYDSIPLATTQIHRVLLAIGGATRRLPKVIPGFEQKPDAQT